MKIAHHLEALSTLPGLAVMARAGELAVSTPAIAVYDAVSYHTHERPLRGNGHNWTKVDDKNPHALENRREGTAAIARPRPSGDLC